MKSSCRNNLNSDQNIGPQCDGERKIAREIFEQFTSSDGSQETLGRLLQTMEEEVLCHRNGACACLKTKTEPSIEEPCTTKRGKINLTKKMPEL